MPICPKCNTEHSKRRKGGVCPSCGTSIIIHNGDWFSEDVEDPINIFIRKYEKLYSLWLTKGTSQSAWRINKHKIARETAQAKEILFNIFNGDIELAIKSLEILFTDSRWKYRNYSTLIFTLNDLYSTKVIASDILEKEKELQQQADTTLDRIGWREL